MDGIRPGWDEYYLEIARTAASRSNCSRRQVGAIIVCHHAIVSTGYNGTPMGVTNCFEGGCARCSSDTESGAGYDTCICVHAEQNAIVLAARRGNSVAGGTLYSTLRPCFGCLKEAIQAGIEKIVFGEIMSYPPDLEAVYQDLVAQTHLKLVAFEPDGDR